MLRTLLSTEGPRLHVVGADDSVRPVPLSLRRGRRPRRPVSARLLFRSVRVDDPVRPVPLSFRASARTGVGIRFPLCTCTLKAARRQQASSHPLTCHGMVPQASRTHFSGITKPRDFRRGVLCWRYLSSRAVSSQVLSAEASLTDLSRDDAEGIPNT